MTESIMTQPNGIHKAMIAVMRDLSAVGKDSTNQHFRYNFRGIDAVYKELHPLLRKHGIYQLPEVKDVKIEREGKTVTAIIEVDYHFVAEDGSSVKCSVCGMGADTGDKATNKAMSGAHKYALLQTFVIPCEGIDEQDASDFEYKAQKPKEQAQAEQAMQGPYTDTPENKAWLWGLMKRFGVENKETAARLHTESAFECRTKSEVYHLVYKLYEIKQLSKEA